MVIPQDVDGLTALESALKSNSVHDILMAMKPTRIQITMPKFRIETCIDLRSMLNEVHK